MNVFIAEYRWSGGWGAFRNIYAVVVAENESVAHSKVLHDYPDTKADLWTFQEVPLDKVDSFWIAEESN